MKTDKNIKLTDDIAAILRKKFPDAKIITFTDDMTLIGPHVTVTWSNGMHVAVSGSQSYNSSIIRLRIEHTEDQYTGGVIDPCDIIKIISEIKRSYLNLLLVAIVGIINSIFLKIKGIIKKQVWRW